MMIDRRLIVFITLYYNFFSFKFIIVLKFFENVIHNKTIKSSLKYESIILIPLSFMHNYNNENSRTEGYPSRYLNCYIYTKEICNKAYA